MLIKPPTKGTELMKAILALTMIALVLFATHLGAQELKIVPYEVRSKFREAGCEIVLVREALRTDLNRQSIFVASCSGLEVYLMAVKCRGKRCAILQ